MLDYDMWWQRLFVRQDAGPVLILPRYIVPTMTGSQLLAEALDILYDVEELPVATSRMVDEGCPNCGGA